MGSKHLATKEKTMLKVTLFIALVLVVFEQPAYPDMMSWTLSTDPSNGAVSGPQGGTAGWGYTIANQSTSAWLVLTDLSSDPFLFGSAVSIFDFPIVAPGATVAVPFDGANGLFQFTWDANAPLGFVNQGIFTASAEWWSGDPLAGGVFLQTALDQRASYSAAVSGVPEPSGVLLLGAVLTLLCGVIPGSRPL
jgi:hypothetical protein